MPGAWGPFVAAIVVALIILGGLYSIARNLAVLLAETARGQQSKAWYDRPYLFRVVASAFTLFWLFGPYQALHLNAGQVQALGFSLYLIAAAAWLWLLRISFLDGIPQHLLKLGPAWGRGLGWQGHLGITYLVQLLCAAGVGLGFTLLGASSFHTSAPKVPIALIVVVPFLLITAAVSSWRISLLAGPDHTVGERLLHVIGGRDAGPPHAHSDAPPETPA